VLRIKKKDCRKRIAGIVNYVTGNLRPVKSETDTELSGWYRQNSLVFVANDHACWADPDLAKKVNKKRFGGVQRSPRVGLGNMMEQHAEASHEWIMQRVSQERSGNTTEEEQAGRMCASERASE
jgi:histone deacetylase 6